MPGLRTPGTIAPSGYEEGTRRYLSLRARQRGIAHRFPSTRLRGMDSQHSRNAQTNSEEGFDVRGRFAARLSKCGNWQLRALGEVRSCTLPSPVSGRLAGDIRMCPPPRGCATTTRRPESRRGPRIGAGWDLVAKSISNLSPAHVSGGRLRYNV